MWKFKQNALIWKKAFSWLCLSFSHAVIRMACWWAPKYPVTLMPKWAEHSSQNQNKFILFLHAELASVVSATCYNVFAAIYISQIISICNKKERLQSEISNSIVPYISLLGQAWKMNYIISKLIVHMKKCMVPESKPKNSLSLT